MGLTEQINEAVSTIAREAQKAIEQGKGKLEELQLERQMDSVARKVGYLELDRLRGRAVDEAVRQDLLQQLATLEDQLVAAQNAKKAAEEAAAAAAPADATTATASDMPAPEAETPADPTPPAGV